MEWTLDPLEWIPEELGSDINQELTYASCDDIRSSWIARFELHHEIADISKTLACSHTIFSNRLPEHYHRWMTLKFGGFPVEPLAVF